MGVWQVYKIYKKWGLIEQYTESKTETQSQKAGRRS